jgi:hypothetical protein
MLRKIMAAKERKRRKENNSQPPTLNRIMNRIYQGKVTAVEVPAPHIPSASTGEVSNFPNQLSAGK